MLAFLTRRERLLAGGAVAGGALAAVAAALGWGWLALVLVSLLASATVLMQLESRAKQRQVLKYLRVLPQQEKARRRQSQAALDRAVQSALDRIDDVGERLVAGAGHERLAGAGRHVDVLARLDDLAESVGHIPDQQARTTESALERSSAAIVQQVGSDLHQHQVHLDERMLAVRTDTVNQVSSVLQLLPRMPSQAPLPAVGGWAAEASTLLALVHCIESTRAQLVVECGSGSSTVWLASAARRTGGRVVALEHDEGYAEQTRAALVQHGLADVAEVRLAPLTAVQVGGRTYSWYDPQALEGLSSINLLFVDGPPKAVGEWARYPALPLLSGRLSPGALVVLDDVHRAEEETILRSWLEDDPQLRRQRDLDERAVLLRYRATA